MVWFKCMTYLTLPSDVPIDVAGHEPRSLSILGSTLGLAFSKVRPVHLVMLSLHCSLDLPLPCLPSTMSSSESLCRESYLMTCPKNDTFLFFTVSISDLIVPAIPYCAEIPKVKIHLDGQEVEQVSKFVYLGELITDNGKSEEEIHRRIEIARKSFSKMRTIMTNPKISIPARQKFIKCFVWSILLYEVETWIISMT